MDRPRRCKAWSAVNVLVPKAGETTTNNNADDVQLPLPINATDKAEPLPDNLPAKYRRRNKNPVLQRGNRRPEDSLDAFAEDLATILHDLRNETRDPDVPYLVNKMTNSRTTRIWRPLSLASTPFSVLTLRILPSWSLFTLWACWAVRKCQEIRMKPVGVDWTVLSVTFSLISICSAKILSQSLLRVQEAKRQQADVIHATEELAQVLANTVHKKDPRLSLKLARHVALYGWLWMLSFRGRASKDNLDEYVIRVSLACQTDADFLLGHHHADTAVLTRIRQATSSLASVQTGNMADEIALDRALSGITRCSQAATRMRNVISSTDTCYASHVSRLAQLFLLGLPLVLYGNLPSSRWTIGISSATAYWLLGLDEMGNVWRRPWECLDLQVTAKGAMKRVADVFLLPPPALMGDDRQYIMNEPPYW